MTTVRLDQQPGHADDVGLVLLGGVEDRRDRLLDAEVDDRVAVVGQDDVDQVLADVVHVALDRGQHDACPCRRRRPSPCAARGRPPRSSSPRRDCSTNGSCICAGAEQLADRLHAVQQRVVDDLQRRARSASASSRSASRPLRSPSMIRRCSRSSSGSAASSSARVARADAAVDALEQLQEPLQRVVALARAGRRPGRGRPRAARPGSGHRQDLRRRARSPSPARPARTRAGRPS